MKATEGFRLRKLGQEFIVVGEGLAQVNFNKMISLNSSAAYLWESIQGKEFTVNDLAQLLVDKYGIDMDLALKDSASIADAWANAGIAQK